MISEITNKAENLNQAGLLSTKKNLKRKEQQ